MLAVINQSNAAVATCYILLVQTASDTWATTEHTHNISFVQSGLSDDWLLFTTSHRLLIQWYQYNSNAMVSSVPLMQKVVPVLIIGAYHNRETLWSQILYMRYLKCFGTIIYCHF